MVIHIEPVQMINLNKSCRYCPRCDLIIVHKDELESLLDAVSAEEVGLARASDEVQLAYAAQTGRVLLTYDIGDYGVLAEHWYLSERHHAGAERWRRGVRGPGVRVPLPRGAEPAGSPEEKGLPHSPHRLHTNAPQSD